MTAAQKAYAVPDAELRASLRQTVVDRIVPLYTRFLERYASLPFSKNPGKYILYKPAELEAHFRHLFDTAL
jgi:exocyst complex component 7